MDTARAAEKRANDLDNSECWIVASSCPKVLESQFDHKLEKLFARLDNIAQGVLPFSRSHPILAAFRQMLTLIKLLLDVESIETTDAICWKFLIIVMMIIII